MQIMQHRPVWAVQSGGPGVRGEALVAVADVQEGRVSARRCAVNPRQAQPVECGGTSQGWEGLDDPRGALLG